MRAALLYEDRKELILDDVEDPKVHEGYALVRVKACGICHSDLNIIDRVLKPPRYPHVLGHEIAGVIEDHKPATDQERKFVEHIISNYDGRVLIHFYITCGRCQYCLRGSDNLCISFRRIGFEEWGGYAEYVAVPIRNLIPLPRNLDYSAAVLVDAGATAYRALRKLDLRVGEMVAVIGIGGLGSMAVQLAKAQGLRVLAIDIYDEKLRYAKDMGADYVLNIHEIEAKLSSKNMRELLNELLGLKEEEGSVSGVIDTVGTSRTITLAMGMLKRAGKIILLGYGIEHNIPIPLIKTIYDEIKIEGSRAASMWEVIETVNIASRNMIKPNVTAEYSLYNINEALDMLRKGKILGRAIIKF